MDRKIDRVEVIEK